MDGGFVVKIVLILFLFAFFPEFSVVLVLSRVFAFVSNYFFKNSAFMLTVNMFFGFSDECNYA